MSRALANALAREWPLVLATLVGLVLRTYQLSGQILVGDEWHALEMAANASYGEIATGFGSADYSIPIALAYRAAAATIGLGEPLLRAPFLACGLATVVLLPLAARRFVGRTTSDVFAWLLAVSPVLVFYSRFARPYAITCFLGLAAVLCFHAWWQTRRRAHALGYVLAAVLGGWLHTAILPFALAPFPFFLVHALRSERRSTELRALAGLGAVAALPLALLLAPAALLDADSLALKTGWGTPYPGTVLRALQVFAGTHAGAMGIALLLLAAFGLARLVRGAPGATALFATAALAQCATVLVLTPAHRGDVFAFARYLLPLVPIALLAVASGVVGLVARGPTERSEARLPPAASLAGPGLAALLLVLGPLPATWPAPDNWTANHLALGILDRREQLVANVPVVPDFYRELAARAPGSVTLVEVPWFPPIFANPLPRYQLVHRQRTRIGFTRAPGGAPAHGQLPYPPSGFHLGNFVFVEELLGAGEPAADYLVLHRDLRREYRLETVPMLAPLMDGLQIDVAPLVERCRARFGAPAREDEWMVVFALH